MESRGKQGLASAKRRPLLAVSVSTTLINTPIHGHSWGCVEPLRDLEPFLRVSRVHPLLIAPGDARFRRDFSMASSLTQGAAQKLRCALRVITQSPLFLPQITFLHASHLEGGNQFQPRQHPNF